MLECRGNEWPSSDSDDSDYCPYEVEDDNWDTDGQPREKKPKRIKPRQTHPVGSAAELSSASSSSCSSASSTPQSVSSSHTPGVTPKYKILKSPTSRRNKPKDIELGEYWSCGLPWEVLHQIFKYVVTMEGALPFLCRVSRVCSSWKDTACHPSLWTKIDLSYGWIKSNEQTLKWLCNNRFTHLREINLSTWKNLTNTGLEKLASSCSNLEVICLSYCSKISSEGMKILLDKCKKLSSLDLSHTNMDATSPVVLRQLLEQHGHRLKRLNVSDNMLKGFQPVFNTLPVHCPQLEVLQLNNVQLTTTTLTVNIEKFQEGCPKLKVLEMSLTSFRAAPASQRVKASSLGFPELEAVSLAIDTNVYMTVGLDDDFLRRLLHQSYKLKLLDLRGSSNIKCHTLQELPATDLQQLYISLSSIAKYTGIEIIVSKWQHSLKDLDLSWNLYPAMSLDCAMRKLSSDPSVSALEILNLSGTSITCDRVKSVIAGCHKLKSLNLCSCRGLPRGMKSEFVGPKLIQLNADIEAHLEQEALSQR